MIFNYSFQSENENGDFEPYIHNIRVDIMLFDDETCDPSIHAGYAEMVYWNRQLSRRHCSEAPSEICDYVSQHMLDLYNDIFQEDSYDLKESVARQLNLEDEIWGSNTLDICLVNRIVVYPEYRGQGILRELLKNIGSQIGTRALIAGIPFPLQFEDKVFRQDAHELDGLPTDITFEEAQKKVRKHYIKIGLKKARSAPRWLFLTPFSLPVKCEF